MGLHDRPYWQESQAKGDGGLLGGARIGFPRPPPVVKWLLLLNIAVFLAQAILGSRKIDLSPWLGVTAAAFWQVWRYLTFQFLHAGFMHIALNMLVLYMFGTSVEQQWGSRRFARFYLTCGVAAGVTYVVMSALLGSRPGMADLRYAPLIGASGGVYGILLACAVLFPHMKMLFFFVPMSMRTGAILILGLAVLYMLGGWGRPEFWSSVAHLGGAGMAAGWLWLGPRLGSPGRLVEAVGGRIRRGAWKRKMRQLEDEQAEIDRILQKVHDGGLASLSRGERKVLQDATRRQQQRDRDLTRL